jgi:hypothetical protein
MGFHYEVGASRWRQLWRCDGPRESDPASDRHSYGRPLSIIRICHVAIDPGGWL